MIPVSDRWKEYAANGGVFRVKAELTGNGRTIQLTDNDFMQGSVTFQDATSPDDALAIGAVVTNTFSATLNNFDGKFNDVNFRGTTLRLLMGIEYGDRTTEYKLRGWYTVEAPNSLGSTIAITGYDEVERLNRRFENIWRNPDTGQRETITYPVPASKLVVGLVQFCNVPMYMNNWKLPEFSVPKFEYDETTTIRQVVSWVLQCCGGYGRISPRGGGTRFYCEWYSSPWNTTEGYDGGVMWETAVDLDGGLMWEDTEEVDGGTITPEPRDLTSKEISVEIDKGDITITGARAYVYGTVDDPISRLVGDVGYVVEIKENPMIKASNMDEVAKNIYRMCGGMTFAPFNASIFASPDIEAGEYCKVSDYLGNERITVISNFDYSIGGSGTVSLGAETPELASQDTVNTTQATINTAVKRSYEYIQTEKLTADVIEGGTLTLGGLNDVSGVLRVLDADGTQIGRWDSTGAEIVGRLNMTGGGINISTSVYDYDVIDLKYGAEDSFWRTQLKSSGLYFFKDSDEYGVYLGAAQGANHDGRVEVTGEGAARTNIGAGTIDFLDAEGGARGFIGTTGFAFSNASYTERIRATASSGNITCVSLTQTSKADSKENIVPFEDRGKPTKRLLKSAPTTALDLVTNTDIYEFNYKDVEDDKKHYGVIIDGEYRCCDEIKAEDGVDTYSMVSVLWQAVKELTAEVRGNNENDNNSDKRNETGDSGDAK